MDLPEGMTSGQPARLIPVVADTSREVRATSVLLATFEAVPQLAKSLLGTLGQKVGTRTTALGFSEVVFSADKNGETFGRPDGFLVLERGGQTTWSALVEAKIGRSVVKEDQLRKYIGLAKSHNVSAIITISNQFVAVPTHHPVRLPKSLTRSVQTFHWSWMNIVTEAILLLNSTEIENPTQRFVLKEMIRYFSHQSVGVSTHDRMNPEWRELVANVQAGVTLNKSSDVVSNSVAAWQEESRDLALLLTRQLNQPVSLKLSRTEQKDPSVRTRQDVETLVSEQQLHCSFSVPNAASPIDVSCDLLRRSVTVSMSLQAPVDRQKATSRINWLVRQLGKTNTDCIHVRARWPGRTPPTQATLHALRVDVASLASAGSLLPSHFDVLLIRDLAGKFSGSKTFLEEVESALPYFYEQVGQHLRTYKPKPPPITTSDRTHSEATESPGTSGDSESQQLLENRSDSLRPFVNSTDGERL